MIIDPLLGMASQTAISNKIDIESKKDVKQELKLVGRIRKIPGLTLYQFNYETLELKPTEIKKNTSVKFEDQTPVEHSKAYMDSKCFYFQCLNLEKAVKKINKFLLSRTGFSSFLIIQNKQAIINPIYENKTITDPAGAIEGEKKSD
jgi:hypothetical protein